MYLNDIPLTETELAVLEVVESRWKIGREHYGKGISYDSGGSDLEWLEQAIEECADQLQYLVSMKLRMQKDRNNGNI
jgi:hypothetical protein